MSAWAVLGGLAPDPRLGAPGLRWSLLGLGLVWALLVWRGRRWPALAGGVLFTGVLLGFWTLSFGRPYGLAEGTPASREAAFAVRASVAPPLGGFVVGQPFEGGRWSRLAALGVPVDVLLRWPTWLPLLVVPAGALLIACLWRTPLAAWGAVLWLAFSTSDLEALGAEGFLDGLWGHPAGALAFLAAAAAALLLGRRGGLMVASAAWLALALAVWLACPATSPPPDAPILLRRLLVDPWPWPLLAVLGLRRDADAAARWCLGLGLAGSLAALAGMPLDAWPARAVWRLGLVLGAVPVLERGLGLLAERLAGGRWRLGPGAGLSLLLVLALPGSFATSWNPYDFDPVAEASTEPLPYPLAQTTTWLRAHLPADAVVVASPAYAPAVVVYGRCRVLRAPGLAAVPDDLRRHRLEQSVFADSAQGRQNALRYGITHVLVGPGDAERWALRARGAAALPARLRPLASPAPGFDVYALDGW